MFSQAEFLRGHELRPVPPHRGLRCRCDCRGAGIDPELVREVVFDNVLKAAVDENSAHGAERRGTVHDAVGSIAIDRVCGLGLKSLALAA